MAAPNSGFIEIMRLFSRALRVVRAPLVVALLAAVLLAVPDQTLEVYRYHIRDWASGSWASASTKGIQHLVAFASLLALGLVLFAIARGLTKADERSSRLLAGAGPEAFLLRHLPGSIGAIPLIASAVGIGLAFRQIQRVLELRDALHALAEKGILQGNARLQTLFETPPHAVKATAYVSMALLLSAAAALIFLPGRRQAWQGRAIDSRASDRRHWALSLAVVCLSIALVFLFAAQSPELGRLLPFPVTALAQLMGSITIACLFLVCMGFLVSMLVRLYDVRGLPIIPALLAIAVLASALNLNDNHAVRTTLLKPGQNVAAEGDSGTLPPARPLALSTAFTTWLDSRPAGYRSAVIAGNQKYPVYVVAAEGGGMAAANQTGLMLARLFDRCPDLAHHVFAISGVSGGGLGAAMFVALQQQAERAAMPAGSTPVSRACALSASQSGNTLEQQLNSVLNNDFLAPIVASGLFPEMAQQFLPFPVSVFDRARALEAALENAWGRQGQGGANIFREPFRAHWRPQGNSPMLVLNATVVESGMQVMIAPFVANLYRDRRRPQALRVLYDANAADAQILQRPDNLDVPLSTAVGLSARFPFVLPAGVVPTTITRSDQHRLLDGGVFENSGIESALLLMEAMDYSRSARLMSKSRDAPEEAAFYKAIDVRLIIVGSAEWTFSYGGNNLFPDASPKSHYPARREGGTEPLSPVRALYRTRTMRGELAVTRAFKSLNREDMRFNMLNYELFNLPVGFQLAKHTQELIAAHVGKADDCWAEERMRELRQKIIDNVPALGIRLNVLHLVDSINANNCSMACIIDEVSPERTPIVETPWCGRTQRAAATR